MSALLPEGVPGCSLYASPDILEVGIPQAGRVTTQIVLPNATSLFGLDVFHQAVPVDFAASAVTATNVLLATIGSL